jgi:hypothetical protein
MRFSCVQGVVLFAAALVLTLVPGAPAQDRQPIQSDKTVAPPQQQEEARKPMLWWGSGRIRAGEREYFVNLWATVPEGGTFTGIIDYDLGLRSQPFKFKGTIYRNMVLLQEEDTPAYVHPHALTRGGARFEGWMRGRTLEGVVFLRMKPRKPEDYFVHPEKVEQG